MKTITLTQPWATLVAIGAKKIETRSWRTSYRGPLAIHAAKGFPKHAQEMCFKSPFRDYLGEYVRLGETYFGKHSFPLGCVIATCELVNVIRFGCMPVWVDSTGRSKLLEKHPIDGYIKIPPDNTNEYEFGDYSAGRYAWILANVKPLPEPIPAKGALGLWEWRMEPYETT